MVIKRLLSSIRKNLIVILLGLLVMPACAHAQFQGFFAQQTVSQSFTGTAAATATHVSVNNLGQAAHAIFSNLGNCSVTLDGSLDGTTYFVLAGVGQVTTPGALGQGYFPILRITINFTNNAACSGLPYKINYIGYQNPIPFVPVSSSGQVFLSPAAGFTSAANIFQSPGNPVLWEATSFSCFNPGAATAFLQILDAGTGAVLGTNILFQQAIPAAQNFQYSGPPLIGSNSLSIGASTTSLGNTAVATGLQCSVQASKTVSFLSTQLISP